MAKKMTNMTGSEIAVIGMAGKFPGAKNIDAFWENLKNGIESLSFISDEELKTLDVDPAWLNNPNYVKAKGGLLEDKELFDASFFGYTPKEAGIMDPQIRIFHECAWSALEDAGYDPGNYDGFIGLYAGAGVSFYWESLTYLSGECEELGYFATGHLNNKDFLSTQIAYKLNLKGPCFTVQTACSTSLVAIHLACQGILYGECSMALAGGVRIAPQKRNGYIYQEGMIASPDGRCRAFDAKARGTVGGEGVGVVLLKSLEDAIADGDHIHAIIKGTAINNDGIRKAGYTAPSIEGQAEVIHMAHQVAEVEPDSIGYIEAHGVGTEIGDPVEIEALKLAFNTTKKNFCAIGSVKTNIGHLDTAAGAAGFIKTVLALKYQLIPPSLHFETANPEIDFENSPFYVVNRPTQWKDNGSPRRAGVSSFGIGGTNAHAILEEAPTFEEKEPMQLTDNSKYFLLLLSAKTPGALRRMSHNFAAYLTKNPGVNLADIAYTLQKGRQTFQYRRTAVCSNVNEAIDTFSVSDAGKFCSFYPKERRRSPIFVFPGIGAQYVNMGAELYRAEPIFRREVDRCFTILNPIINFDLKNILYPPCQAATTAAPPSISFNNIEIAQLVVFILEYALAKLIMGLGIKPHAMIGYSLGEYTAACLSGVFSLEDALKIIATRGRLIGKLPMGTMLSVPMQASKIKPLLGNEVFLSIDNGFSCIVTGTDQDLAAFKQKLKENRHLCMRLPNTHAIHSRMMEPISKEFNEYLGAITHNKPQIPYVSNVTGQWISGEDTMDPGYWSRHLTQTVRFADGIDLLKKELNPFFIEIGPGRDLSTLLARYKESDPDLQSVNLIRPEQQDVPDNYYLWSKIGNLWLNGVHIDWNGFYNGEKRLRVPLPTYPFEKRRFWFAGNPFSRVAELVNGQSLTPGGPNVQFIDSLQEETEVPGENKRAELSTPYSPPSTETQQILVDIWENYFGIKPVGIEDNFFELGGDSLKAIIIIKEICKKLAIELDINEFIKNPTIINLELSIENRARGEKLLNKIFGDKGILDIKPGKSQVESEEIKKELLKYVENPMMLLNEDISMPDRTKIFCFPPAGAHMLAYKTLSILIPNYAIHSFNFIEAEDRVRQYVEIITATQTQGAYILLGHSAAYKLIFEVTKALENNGSQVSDIVIVDSFWPNRHSSTENQESFIEEIRQYLDKTGVGFLKEQVTEKIKVFNKYFGHKAKPEIINANIHLLLSEENKNSPKVRCWEEFTTKGSFTYQGYGPHSLMMDIGAVEKNAEVIREILDKIQSKAKGATSEPRTVQ